MRKITKKTMRRLTTVYEDRLPLYTIEERTESFAEEITQSIPKTAPQAPGRLPALILNPRLKQVLSRL